MVNFIQQEIENDLKAGKYVDGVHTRFPPEPNGYLHVGHELQRRHLQPAL